MSLSGAKELLLQGNEAVVEAALAVGCRFYAGYPITPSTEIAEGMAARLPPLGGTFIQMEDEIASLGACLGASLAGAKAMTATSGPGMSLMQELIGYGCIAEIPVVIVNVMRAGPSTGLPTSPSQGDVMQARWGTHGDHPIIVLTASGVREAFDMTVKAFNFAEKYRNPVILLLDEVVGHMREKVRLPAPEAVQRIERIRPTMPPEWYVPYEETNTGVPPMAVFGDGYRYHVTGLTHDRMGFPTQKRNEILEGTDRLFRKITQGFREVCLTEAVSVEDASAVVVAYGSVARSAREAVETLRAQGKHVGLLKLQTLWPFPRAAFEKFLGRVQSVLVCEMNRGQVYREVLRVARGRCEVRKLSRVDGELVTPGEIARALREVV
ncbi:MAG: 2-oxoacid:acceptor oxidoreductase subunit alpha [Deltaproteobacteria bacterium]|nr:2-oxoacid:acceptor oxidoreductase subunit alpha [Deltaproteobacteria bacterium]